MGMGVYVLALPVASGWYFFTGSAGWVPTGGVWRNPTAATARADWPRDASQTRNSAKRRRCRWRRSAGHDACAGCSLQRRATDGALTTAGTVPAAGNTAARHGGRRERDGGRRQRARTRRNDGAASVRQLRRARVAAKLAAPAAACPEAVGWPVLLAEKLSARPCRRTYFGLQGLALLSVISDSDNTVASRSQQKKPGELASPLIIRPRRPAQSVSARPSRTHGLRCATVPVPKLCKYICRVLDAGSRPGPNRLTLRKCYCWLSLVRMDVDAIRCRFLAR